MKIKISTIILLIFFSKSSIAEDNNIKTESYGKSIKIEEIIFNKSENRIERVFKDEKFSAEIRKTEDGFYVFKNGLYKNSDGEIYFDLKIKKSKLSESFDYLDILTKSEKFIIKSNSTSINNFFNFIDEGVIFNESYHIVKNKGKYFVKNLSFETLDYKFDFKGELVMVYDNLIIERAAYRVNGDENYIEGYSFNDFISNELEHFIKDEIN